MRRHAPIPARWPGQRQILLERLLKWDGLTDFEIAFCRQMQPHAGKYARPPTPKQDSSATSNMLPHCGQFGRLNFAFADVREIRPSYAGWTIIVDSPRRPFTAPNQATPCKESMALPRRDRETVMAVDDLGAQREQKLFCRAC